MRFEIRHATRYRYSTPVFLEPHTLRFRPRSTSWQRLLDFDLQIHPAPTRTSATLDLDGNESLVAWFDGLTTHLALEARSEVATLRTNPFDFLWEGARTLPMAYHASTEVHLAPYRRHRSNPILRPYGENVARISAGDAQAFLAALAGTLHESFRQIVRLEGDPLPPEQTLNAGEGACRDLAVLYIALAREMGFAARFVSGYSASEGAEQNELHAWAEVYVPGGGWRGFDPSTGLAVAAQHIGVASGAEPHLAAPVAGSFRGDGRPSPIDTEVTIRSLD